MSTICNARLILALGMSLLCSHLSTAEVCLSHRDILYAANADFAEALHGCGVAEHRHLIGRGPRTDQCLAEIYPMINEACLGCFHDMAACGVRHCKLACVLNARSEKCQACTRHYCAETFAQCSGLTIDEIPQLVP